MRPNIVSLAAAYFLIGCQPAPSPEPSPAPPSAEVARAASCTAQWKTHGSGTQAEAKAFGRECLRQQGAIAQTLTEAAMDANLASTIGREHALSALNPADMDVFCPTYGTLAPAERATVWQRMLKQMARQESAFMAAEPYWEFGQGQYSIGLLQLSQSDEQGYHCGIQSEVDLTRADFNLQCGASILATLVRRAGRVGGDTAHVSAGGAAYWSTLRETNSTPPVGAPPADSRSRIIAATRSLTICRTARPV